MKSVLRFLRGYSPQILILFATIVSTIGASSEAWVFWFTTVFVVLAAILQFKFQRPNYMQLSKEHEEMSVVKTVMSAEIEKAVHVLLRLLAKHCGRETNDDRVSIYYYHDDHFIMISRFSHNPAYCRPGRSEYPEGEGAIGQAWLKTQFVLRELPASRKNWEEKLIEKLKYTPEVVSKMNMASRSIGALRIENDNHSVGVIVFESMGKTRIDHNIMLKVSESLLFQALSELVETTALLTPRGQDAQKNASKENKTEETWKASKKASPVS